MIFVYIVLIVIGGAVGIKYVHQQDTKPVEHVQDCEKKPDCKCDVLEAGKVIIK